MNSSSPRMTCLTGAGQTGANAYLLEIGSWCLLLDAGAASSSWASWTRTLARMPDAVWISHVHADHIGALGALHKREPSLSVLMTPQSVALLPAALRHQDQRKHTHSAGKTLAALTTPIAYHHVHLIEIDATTRVRLTPYPCGHMLGAASLYLEIERDEKFHTILYLPDFSAHGLAIVPRAAFPLHDPEAPLDLLLMEGMLGAHKQADAVDFDEQLAALVALITHQRAPGGQLLALSALGDCCELAWALVRDGGLDRLVVHDYLEPVFEVYESALPDEACWKERGVFFASQSECEALLVAGHVVIASGEHLEDGSPAHRLAMRIKGDATARIVLLNSVRQNSFAGRLLAGRLDFPVQIVHRLLPSHAPRWALKGAFKALKPRHTWLIHGQKSSLASLAKALRIQQRGRKWAGRITVPETGDVLVIDE